MKLYFISTYLRVCRVSRGHNNLQTIVYRFLCLILSRAYRQQTIYTDCIIDITTLLNLKLYYHYR